MAELASAVEAPKTQEDKKHIAHRIGSFIGDYALGQVVYPLADGRMTRNAAETAKEALADDTTRRIAGSLALFGAAATAAEFGHWLDHTNKVLEFLQDSGRHFLVGYLGAELALAKSRAKTVGGKIAAGLIGGTGAYFFSEAAQSLEVTVGLHGGSLRDFISFVSHKEIFNGMKGNGLDEAAAAASSIVAGVQAIAAERS